MSPQQKQRIQVHNFLLCARNDEIVNTWQYTYKLQQILFKNRNESTWSDPAEDKLLAQSANKKFKSRYQNTCPTSPLSHTRYRIPFNEITTLDLKLIIKHQNALCALCNQKSGHNNPKGLNSVTMQHANRTRLELGLSTAFKTIH